MNPQTHESMLQEYGGTITGVVVDAQGAVLPGVTVEVANDGEHSVVISDANGQFQVSVTPGVYVVRASLSGFTTLVREGVRVDSGRSASLRLPLSLFGPRGNGDSDRGESQLCRRGLVHEALTANGCSPRKPWKSDAPTAGRRCQH